MNNCLTNSRVRFATVNQKFVETKEEIPESAKEVMYYSLAIGHHIGVIDCFKTLFECSYDDYKRWIAKLPQEGNARRKFDGLLRFGEIVIDHSHVQLLAQALHAAKPQFSQAELEWTEKLINVLGAIDVEPAMYVMVRRIDG